VLLEWAEIPIARLIKRLQYSVIPGRTIYPGHFTRTSGEKGR